MSQSNRYEDELLSEDPSLPPAKTVKEEESLRYTVKCFIERKVAAVDGKIKTAVWFQTEPLDATFINRIKAIRLKTTSHDQGYVGDSLAGNWTWFELSILANGSKEHSEGLTLTWESHRNLMGTRNYGGFEGNKFDSRHDLLKFLKDGDVIAVRLCARFAGWEIYANEGWLIFDLFDQEVPRDPPNYEPYIEGIKAMDGIIREINVATQPEDMKRFISRVPATTFRADIFAAVDERSLRVLCLDGGGVRGLASLHILNAVMKKLTPGKLPCEVFDMIAGTSTGGLIAIMLGRLKMSVDECIQKYNTLMDDVFSGWTWVNWAKEGQWYDATNLEKAIKSLIKEKLGDEEVLLLDDDETNPCKIFLTAVYERAANNREPLLLRSYQNPQEISELPRIKLWQAARATSAAPSYFAPISVDKYKQVNGKLVSVGTYRLVDGGLLANNPLGWLWTEILGVFGAMRETACFLSIGTGIDANRAVAQPGASRIPGPAVVTSFASIATNTEVIHILFRGLINAFAPQARVSKYWRLNVYEEIPGYDEERGTHVYYTQGNRPDNYVGLVEIWDTKGARNQLMKMTNKYLERDDVKEAIEACAKALNESEKNQ